MRNLFSFFLLLVFLVCTCTSCGNKDASTPYSASAQTAQSSQAVAHTAKGTRDNTPTCLVPSADGTNTDSCDVATIDFSHSAEGYIMVKYMGTCAKVKLQITGPNQITYTYNLSGGFEAFPLSSESGNYNIAIFENIEGNQYSTAMSSDLDVTIANEFGPYLYPNQYVDFTQDCAAVQKGVDLAFSANSDLEVITNVYNYVISNISYDYDKAENIQSGYIPNVDNTLQSQTGICLDYAALMASMLRSQSIPTRLEVGYAGDAYHAWISTHIDEVGWVNGIIEFNGKEWSLMDPTFAANSSEKSLKDFIGNGNNYTTKYIY